MSLFDNGNTEDFLLLVFNFNMTLGAAGTLETAAKIQYLCTLVRGEYLCWFDLMSDDAESENLLTVETIILGLGA